VFLNADTNICFSSFITHILVFADIYSKLQHFCVSKEMSLRQEEVWCTDKSTDWKHSIYVWDLRVPLSKKAKKKQKAPKIVWLLQDMIFWNNHEISVWVWKICQDYPLDGNNCKLGYKWAVGTMWKARRRNRSNIVFHCALYRSVQWEGKQYNNNIWRPILA